MAIGGDKPERSGINCAGGTCSNGERGPYHRRLYDGEQEERGCTRLVWYEAHDEIGRAVFRERSIKPYRRANKINLILAMNPDWKDPWFSITG